MKFTVIIRLEGEMNETGYTQTPWQVYRTYQNERDAMRAARTAHVQGEVITSLMCIEHTTEHELERIVRTMNEELEMTIPHSILRTLSVDALSRWCANQRAVGEGREFTIEVLGRAGIPEQIARAIYEHGKVLAEPYLRKREAVETTDTRGD